MGGFTPALIASVRYRYEQTDEDIRAIALAHGISERSIYRLALREDWSPRSERPRYDLPPAMRLLEDARALAEAQAAARTQIAAATAPPVAAATPGAGSPSAGSGAPPAPPMDTAAAIKRLERLVEAEIAAEEALRAQLGSMPRKPSEAARAARTLATLTQTLHALARLRCGIPADVERDDDDLPADIDEFRRELARRIRVFVQSRTG